MRRLPLTLRRALLPALLLGLTACGSGVPTPAVTPGTARSLPAERAPTVVRVDTLLQGLEVPWGVVELPTGGIVVAERPGRIRYRAPDADSSIVWTTLDVYANEEGIGPEAGLLGLALDPDTREGKVLYALATTWRSAGDRERALATRLWRRVAALASPTGALKYKNQVLRIHHRPDGSMNTTVVVDDLPTAFYHAGGSITIGPDGHLYVGVGDAILPALAGDPAFLTGKILRYTKTGEIPADNPNPASPVFASGLRNTQAVAWLPDGTLLGADHGPSGMEQEQARTGLDELNVLVTGGDYGWPQVTGWDRAEGIRTPIWVWERAIAPAGMAVWSQNVSGDSARVIVGALRGHLEAITLERHADGWTAVGQARFADGTFGRIRSVVRGRDGSLLVTTSNRDARGVARPGDDLLLRLTLAP